MTTVPGTLIAAHPTMALTSDDQLGFIADAVRTFAGVSQLAKVISDMDSCPSHLKGKPADCFRVVVQAVKWRMDPFAVAECTSLVHGRLCYEGKLVAAVLRSMGAIVGRLEHEITGIGQDASVTVTGTPKGARKPCSISGTVKNWRTNGKGKDGQPMKNAWDTMPETMLVYRGTRQWARLFAPEAILGVYTPDERAEEIEVVGTVVDTEPAPARTAPAPGSSTAPADSSPATDQAPAPPAQAAAPAAPHPSIHLAAARALFKSLEAKHGKGVGSTVIERLCKIHGAETPTKVSDTKLATFGEDVKELVSVGDDIQAVESLLTKWEDAEQDIKAQQQEGGK